MLFSTEVIAKLVVSSVLKSSLAALQVTCRQMGKMRPEEKLVSRKYNPGPSIGLAIAAAVQAAVKIWGISPLMEVRSVPPQKIIRGLNDTNIDGEVIGYTFRRTVEVHINRNPDMEHPWTEFEARITVELSGYQPAEVDPREPNWRVISVKVDQSGLKTTAWRKIAELNGRLEVEYWSPFPVWRYAYQPSTGLVLGTTFPE